MTRESKNVDVLARVGSDDHEPLELRLARAARDEAEQHRKAAQKDLEAAQTERAHIERRHRDIAELEANISHPEQNRRIREHLKRKESESGHSRE